MVWVQKDLFPYPLKCLKICAKDRIDWFIILPAILTFSGRKKKTSGGEGEGIKFHMQGMRKARPVLAGVGVNGLNMQSCNIVPLFCYSGPRYPPHFGISEGIIFLLLP